MEGRAKLIITDDRPADDRPADNQPADDRPADNGPTKCRAADVAVLSEGRFGPHPASVYDAWPEFTSWAATLNPGDVVGEAFTPAQAGPPSPTPRQVFAVALNYVDHAAESGFKPPERPLFFTKFVSAFSGPISEVRIPSPAAKVDWETELVAIIGAPARQIDPAEAWKHIAGLTVGQDISERGLQRSGPAPQYSLGKSHAGFAPSGPWLVTADELADPNDLAIGCEVNGVPMQSARTADMIFPVAALVSYLSQVVTLYPGDVVFTGTPPGVGAGRDTYLTPGDVLTSHIEGIGALRQTFVAQTFVAQTFVAQTSAAQTTAAQTTAPQT